MTIRIRPATPTDHAAVEAIENAADRLLVEWLGASDWPAAPSGQSRAEQDGFLLVLEVDGEVVGFAHVLQLDGLTHLEQLSVAPDHSRRGYGRQLLQAARDEARSRGHHRLTLRTYAEVPWNAPFYRRAGFVDDLPTTAFHRQLIEVEEQLGLDRYGPRVQLVARLDLEQVSPSQQWPAARCPARDAQG